MSLLNLFLDLSIAIMAQDHPINYVEFGSRGEFQDDIFPLGFSVNAIGFELEPSEFTRLISRADRLG